MPKCKKCGIDDLTWDREYHESTNKWRLWNPSTERPHECVAKKTGDYDQQGMSKHDRELWKAAWRPEMDLPSQRICGLCKSVCVVVSDCQYCEQFQLNPCECWCPKCEKHPLLIFVEKEPKAYAEFLKNNSESTT